MEGNPVRHVVLVPAPAQGHITPMMQLGKTLQSKGFSITVAQTKFNHLNPSDDFPGFRFVTVSDSLPESELTFLGLIEFLTKLNQVCEISFRDCLARLMQQGDAICCVIYDEFMYFSEAVAKRLKLASIIFSTSNATAFLTRSVLGKVKANGFLAPLKESESQDKLVAEFHPLRFKDLPTSAFASVDDALKLYENSGNKKTSAAVVVNTASRLESISLAHLRQEMQIPVYPIGPLHFTASVPSSLLKEDMSCIEWLNKQKPSSVLYISLGSLALMEIKEVVEMACGLADSDQPFLWVIKPGSIPGSQWIEALPNELNRKASERGYIVKWAPQKEILAHSAVGGFWSHCGWNSTLESIGEGVPMICRPFTGDQKVNARYLDRVWRIGILLEGELERGGVGRAVRKLMVEQEGKDMKKRVLGLKETLEASVSRGGSSYDSLEQLINFIKTCSE